ncbi:MAG: MFS transporter [Chloroflexi bacterium]|nr:MAG: MFS transporter [Chloroflexota bacterium]TMD80758.1 MAG: MFS transporter [Chloroflexota bacterium]
MNTIRATPPTVAPRRRPVVQISALQYPEFRRYFVGQTVSVTGTWMQTVAAAWLVLQLSHDSAFALAVFGAFSYAPVLLFGLYAGTVVDRFSHRDVLLVTQAVSLAGAVLYAVLTVTHTITLPAVMVLAAALGVNQALYFPARQATVLEMVGRGELASAVALNSTAFNLARIIGPAVGGIVIAAFGVAACFWLNAVSYLGVIAALLTVRRRPRTEGPPQTAVQLITEALRYVARTRALAGLFLLLFVAGTFGANFNLVLPLFTRIVLHANADTLGYLFAAQGLGSLVGALTMTIAGGFLLEPRRIVMGGLLFAGMELVFLVMPSFGQAIVLLLVIGWSFAVYSIGTNTFVQVRSPDRMQGRMVSLYSMLFIGVTPIGNIWAGIVAHLFGPSAAVWMGGALTAVAGLAVLAYFLSFHPSRG